MVRLMKICSLIETKPIKFLINVENNINDVMFPYGIIIVTF